MNCTSPLRDREGEREGVEREGVDAVLRDGRFTTGLSAAYHPFSFQISIYGAPRQSRQVSI